MKNIAINPEDYTILAVDDIATNIMLLKAVLSRAKYKIVTASGGNEALEKAATELPDPAGHHDARHGRLRGDQTPEG